ncbi:MAG TPA: hypothetical protein PLI77_06910 [Bacteroidales bacterium]|nr:hypothetical protein [Bacteroidales bacterium]
MEPKSCAIIGASGLIGKEILKQVVLNPLYSEIRIITRRPLGNTDPKIKEIIIDFENLSQLKSSLEGVTDVFCVVGTTQKKVNGDKYLYRKVDYNIPVDAAQISVEHGAQYFVAKAMIQYANQSKGVHILHYKEMGQLLR